MEATQEGRSLLLEIQMAGVKHRQKDEEDSLLNRASQVI